MRYEVRHNNQTWHVFDTLVYTAVAAHALESRAFAHVCNLNGQPNRRPASLLG
ncbi:hypothetical protein WIX39_026245 [Variovorax sp. AB1(2024)]|uniref:hypothetical protein n=1 Tax=Variovorax sp. AB1(2024) TaxID=3132214 RepID=UPI00309AC8DB